MKLTEKNIKVIGAYFFDVLFFFASGVFKCSVSGKKNCTVDLKSKKEDSTITQWNILIIFRNILCL